MVSEYRLAMDSLQPIEPADPVVAIEPVLFSAKSVSTWADANPRHRNWPVVYTINNARQVYVGESGNAAHRMRQHLANPEKSGLKHVRIVLDDTFNKSVCLDLESFLIRMFSGDGKLEVLNRCDGIVDADYYRRADYQARFAEVFEQLRNEGLFDRRIPEIENSDLFKLSPFKALNTDQEIAIEDVLEGLFADIERGDTSTAVVQGAPGTGKTIVAIYLIKLLCDIRDRALADEPDAESIFDQFFTEGYPELLASARIGFVVPQQSLRASVKKVFKKTPGLTESMVVTPFDAAKDPEPYDLLVVDETHRLTQYASQAMGTLTRDFRIYSKALAREGEDWQDLTQIDWILRRSKHQVFLLDAAQGVRPSDVPAAALDALTVRGRTYRLRSQMRVKGGTEYIDYVREVLGDSPPASPVHIENYDLRFFDDAAEMYREIRARDAEVGLSRLLAGYAWEWKSNKGGSGVNDVVVGDLALPWNRTNKDWINSPTSLDEVGSIHTTQGYDLNYAGVIIGADLKWDEAKRAVVFDRSNYFDARGKANNGLRGVEYTDGDLRELVRNIYVVLLTRGIRGTYVYVCDPGLRERLRPYFDMAG